MNNTTLVLPATDSGGKPCLAMLTARTYRIEPTFHRCFATHMALAEEDIDPFSCLKPFTDVVVRGSAHSTRGFVRSLNTSVQVGTLRKNVRVMGDRTIQIGPSGRFQFSEPLPFQSMPLGWEFAYGGRDRHLEEKLLRLRSTGFGRSEDGETLAYPRNPVGRGFAIDVDRERLSGTLAPNLEDPEDPVTPDRLVAKNFLDWIDRPLAACYETVDWFWFPRVSFWLGAEHLPPMRPIQEVRRGILKKQDLEPRSMETAPDMRAYQSGAMGLSNTQLQGGERVSLLNQHPRYEVMEFVLPGERPRFLLEPPGCGAKELAVQQKTVLIEPDQERLTLTWAATLEVAAPYPEELCNEMRRSVAWP